MIGSVAAGAAVAAVAGYFAAPAPYFELALRLQRRASGLATKTVEVDGHRIVYLDGGRGAPVLLLHGFGANRDNWTLLARALTPHFRVIAPDLPGFGASSRVPAASYSLDAQLARLEAFTRALALERFHLGGNSMGGYLAGHYAVRHPESVQSLWLLAPAGVASAAPSELMQALARGENPLLVQSEADFARVIDLCFVDPPWMPAGFRRVLARRSMADAAFHARLFADLFTDPLAFEDSLPGLTVPTLVTWGERDRILDASGARILHALLPGSRLDLMPETGHVPMMERPAATAAAFLAFQRAP
jgi:pimeloyl-ACP methyl ester carboxylesterase